jgi:ABC-2 type transport system permease protein
MNMRRVGWIVWKEFLQFRRDRLLFPIIFIMPIVQLLLFGYVVGADVTNLPTAVVDYDNSVVSHQIVEAMTSSGYFTVVAQPSRESELQPLIDSGKVKVAFVIAKGTQGELAAGRVVPFGIVVDGTDAKTASVASGYASQIVATFNAQRLAMASALAGQGAFVGTVRVQFNPSVKAVNAMVPGLIATILMLSLVAIMSQAVVREQARGTLEQMLVTPLTRGEYLLGKVTPYAVIATVQMSFVALVGRLWFHVPFNGSFFTVALGLFIFMFTSIGIGLLISLVSHTQAQAQQMMMFVLIPTIVLSGFMFPIESMPAPIVPLTYFIPLRYALIVVRSSFLKGSSIADLAVPLLAMVAFSVVIFGAAVISFRRRLGE